MASAGSANQGDRPGAGGPTERRFFAVPIDALDYQTLQMDLYLKFEGKRHTLYRESGVPFTFADAERLAEQGVQSIYVPAQQHGAYRRVLTESMARCFCDRALPPAERGRAIRNSCKRVIAETLRVAGATEPIQAVVEVSRAFALWSAQDPKVFSYLLDMSSHDLETAEHMLNVGVASGLLSRAIAPHDDELFQVAVQGGMLHDIGKRGIPEHLLNKEGRLSSEEWRLFSAHPTRGYEELRKNLIIPEAVLSIVRDHHERVDGGGYPRGLRGANIATPTRICAVADVYDAITARRPYRGATPPLETLRIMAEGRNKHFDPRIFDAFAGLVSGMLDADPSRGRGMPGSSGDDRSLEVMMPAPPTVMLGLVASRAPGSRLWTDERRSSDRHPCNATVRSTFHYQGKALPVSPGEEFSATLLDVGKGGLRVRSPWPMSIGDTLTVQLPGRDGVHVRCLAKVVRVRKDESGGWTAGLSFARTVGHAADAA